MTFFIALAACTSESGPGVDSAPPAVDATDPAPDWSMAGCVEIGHIVYGTPETTATCKRAYLGSKDFTLSVDCVEEDGRYRSTRYTYDDALCEVGEDYFSQGFETTSWTGTCRTCDAHGEVLTEDIAYTERDAEGTYEFSAGSHRYDNVYDDAGHLVQREDDWQSDGDAGVTNEEWIYEGGVLRTYVLLGLSYWERYEIEYSYDDAGRMVEEWRQITYPDGSVWVSRNTHTWDDLDRHTGVLYDEDDNGTVNATAAWAFLGDSPWVQVEVYDQNGDGASDYVQTLGWLCP